jgi:secreted Zn-dependent insulinase-like peptidase
VTDPDQMNNHLDKVFLSLYDRVDKMDYAKFQTLKELLMKELTKPFSNLQEKSDDDWNYITQNISNSNLRQNMIKMLDSLTQNNLKDFFTINFVSSPKKLSIRLYRAPDLLNSLTEESYGVLNSNIKSSIYFKYDFLSKVQRKERRYIKK